MIQFLRSVFAPRVDKIVADFSKVVTKLENAVNFHTMEAEVANKLQEKAAAAEARARKEVARAKAVADKIRALLS